MDDPRESSRASGNGKRVLGESWNRLVGEPIQNRLEGLTIEGGKRGKKVGDGRVNFENSLIKSIFPNASTASLGDLRMIGAWVQ